MVNNTVSVVRGGQLLMIISKSVTKDVDLVIVLLKRWFVDS